MKVDENVQYYVNVIQNFLKLNKNCFKFLKLSLMSTSAK